MPAYNTKAIFFLPVLLTLIFLSVLNIFIYLNREAKVYVVDTTGSELAFWEQILKENPTYRDAYLVLAQLKKQNGDETYSQRLVTEAQKIDPYFVLGASASKN